MAGIELRSVAFGDHDPLPDRAAHRGANVSPPLSWSDPPAGTEELMLVCEDPDGGGQPFLHWLVTGIDPSTRAVAEGEVPPGGQEWPNGFGELGYGGPQPPPGARHRYVFRLYALPGPPRLPVTPSAADAHRAAARQLASGELVGTYPR